MLFLVLFLSLYSFVKSEQFIIQSLSGELSPTPMGICVISNPLGSPKYSIFRCADTRDKVWQQKYTDEGCTQASGEPIWIQSGSAVGEANYFECTGDSTSYAKFNYVMLAFLLFFCFF